VGDVGVSEGMVGVLLAGGGSRRMGRDKALLDWHGRALISHQRGLLSEAGCERVVVSRNAPGCTADYFPDSGPLGGIQAVVRDHPAAGYLVIPVDMPLLCPATLGSLLRVGMAQGHCHYRRFWLPCFLSGADAVGLERLLRSRLQRGARSLSGLLRALDARPLEGGGEQAQFINTNTPEDWRVATRHRVFPDAAIQETGS